MSDLTADEAEKLEAMKEAAAKQAKDWAKEFEANGPAAVQRHIDKGSYPQGHPKTQQAMRWLRDRAQ